MKIATAFIITAITTALAAPAPQDPDMAVDMERRSPEQADALPVIKDYDFHEDDYGYGHYVVRRGRPKHEGKHEGYPKQDESKAWWGGGYGWRPYGWRPYPYWGPGPYWGGGYGWGGRGYWRGHH